MPVDPEASHDAVKERANPTLDYAGLFCGYTLP